jgi:TRAP-type C4-dicarboxylate transport system substrate-binding protein
MKASLSRAGILAVAAVIYAMPASAEVTLNVNSWAAPGYPLNPQTVALCDDIAKVTQSRVKCNILPKAVASPTQTYDAVASGVVDIGYIVHGYTAGRFVLTEAPEFPLMGDNAEVMSAAYQRIHDRMLAKANEHKGVVVLAVHTHGPGLIFNNRRPVEKLSDLDGLKMRVGGGVINNVAKLVGAVPLLKPATEVYELISGGVADGVFFAKDGIAPYKLDGIIKYVTYVPGGFYNISFGWLANPAKWASIPESDRKLIQPLLGEALARRLGKAFDVEEKKGLEALKKQNIGVHTASPEFIKELSAKLAPLEKDWIDRAAKLNVDGAAVLKALRAENKLLSSGGH